MCVLRRAPQLTVRVRIDGEGGPFRFTTAYCPNGKNLDHDDYPRKLAWFDTLAAHVAETTDPSEPAVLCGDFNICRAAIDSWHSALSASTPACSRCCGVEYK